MNAAFLQLLRLPSALRPDSSPARTSGELAGGDACATRSENCWLRFQRLDKWFGPVHALDGLELTIEAGSILALLGPNGAGKSTLFGCLLGLVRPSSGRVLFRGREIEPRDRQRFGYAAERIALYPHRSVWENGLFFARLKNQGANELELQLKRVGLYGVRHRPVRQLSKGMLQRLGLAIALCGQPEVLVLDEPFNGLDPALLDELQAILTEEHERGATLLISTHTMSAIEPLATHVAILLDGKLALHESVEALRQEHGPGETLEAIYHRITRELVGTTSTSSQTSRSVDRGRPGNMGTKSSLPRA